MIEMQLFLLWVLINRMEILSLFQYTRAGFFSVQWSGKSLTYVHLYVNWSVFYPLGHVAYNCHMSVFALQKTFCVLDSNLTGLYNA